MAADLKNINLEYYAYFREVRRLSKETIATEAGSPRELFDDMIKRFGFRTDRDSVRVAVNDVLVSWDRPLADGDTVVFLTPFGGG